MRRLSEIEFLNDGGSIRTVMYENTDLVSLKIIYNSDGSEKMYYKYYLNDKNDLYTQFIEINKFIDGEFILY